MKLFSSHGHYKRATRKGARLGRLAGMVSALVLLSLLSFYVDWPRVISAARQMREAFLNHEIFAVREIKVKGGEKVGGSEVVAMAGLSHGVSIWKVEPRAIEGKVARHPWVRRVLAWREFPRRVVIEVEEREAKAIAVLGELYYVDREGFIFKAVEEGEGTEFPLLTGLQQPALGHPTSFSTRQKIRQALRLNELMAQGSLALSEVHFLPQGGVVLYPLAYRLALHMGWGDWDEKLKRLERVLALWKDKEDRLAVLDLSFRDQIVARLRKVEGNPHPSLSLEGRGLKVRAERVKGSKG